MSEQKKPSLWQKLKNTQTNRAAVITLVVLIAALVVTVAITVANNRVKKENPPADTDSPISDRVPEQNPPQTEPPANTDKPAEPEKPSTNTGSTNVENKLPSFLLPVSGALSKKHDPELQVYSSTMNDLRVHVGIDIVTDAAASVYAAADGKITRIWEDTRMGHCIAISHSGDCVTIYKNLSETLPDGIREGVTVRSGQLIASVGESAMIELAEEPHLHFEMTVGDLMVDPLEYFDEKALESLSLDASYGE